MKKTLLILGLIFCLNSIDAQIYKAKDGTTAITFFSEAPMENIEALNKGAIIVLNTNSNDLQIRVSISNFKFKNALMEEHFNENYMETEKKGPKDASGAVTYPNRNAIFKGRINEKIDYSKDGENKVTITGKMEIHGTPKDVTIDGILTKAGNEINISSKFKIKVADYNIKVPSMYVKNIAEVVDVTINSTLEPFQKK
ncbi:MAG: YceI family protein [Bacteroidota bacterium]